MRKEAFEKTESTEIIFVLDESGSMHSLREEAVEGFNDFITEQKSVDGEAYLTLITLDSEPDVILEGRDIQDVNTIGYGDYDPSGRTALFDAIGKGLESGNASKAENVIMVILTDGMENASSEYDFETITNKIKEKRDEGWDILYLSSNLDSFNDASNIGIDINCMRSYTHDGEGYTEAIDAINTAAINSRTGQNPTEDNSWGNVENQSD